MKNQQVNHAEAIPHSEVETRSTLSVAEFTTRKSPLTGEPYPSSQASSATNLSTLVANAMVTFKTIQRTDFRSAVTQCLEILPHMTRQKLQISYLYALSEMNSFGWRNQCLPKQKRDWKENG